MKMTDRERLIGLLSEYDFDSTFCNICERADDDCAVCGSERLADYLIEHGVIVPPCKAGDTLCCESAIKGHITYLKAPDLEWIFENREIFGKEIFLTREEAEKKLKECKRNV